MQAGTMAEREQIYTVEEVAAILRIAPKTVRKMITTRQIDAFSIGGYYRITKSALDEFIREGESKTKDKQEN